MKCSQKPVVLQTYRYYLNADHPHWIVGKFLIRYPDAEISAARGIVTAHPGDWIVKGLDAQLYVFSDHFVGLHFDMHYGTVGD